MAISYCHIAFKGLWFNTLHGAQPLIAAAVVQGAPKLNKGASGLHIKGKSSMGASGLHIRGKSSLVNNALISP